MTTARATTELALVEAAIDSILTGKVQDKETGGPGHRNRYLMLDLPTLYERQRELTNIINSDASGTAEIGVAIG
ncbi:hypothetical protein CMI47_04275 [Candidatus Pacearchaeota archaeon]|jgi:hypothetical protein|nr:hypothetical protein [Candidatus Pacearchaeota archaeon]|tara:strand:+ start:7924 stop:8145 length:222 start_codon:yes stop_codon:yes gene_type:complete